MHIHFSKTARWQHLFFKIWMLRSKQKHSYVYIYNIFQFTIYTCCSCSNEWGIWGSSSSGEILEQLVEQLTMKVSLDNSLKPCSGIVMYCLAALPKNKFPGVINKVCHHHKKTLHGSYKVDLSSFLSSNILKSYILVWTAHLVFLTLITMGQYWIGFSLLYQAHSGTIFT